jgi:two-component system, OmpR family, sensor histidine kinase KdpD
MTPARGKLKIFMGYAAGVGKTYAMLVAGQELRARGVDVVIGYLETHGRQDTIDKAAGLELVARKTMDYRGTSFEEMDTDAVLARNPAVALVDEFPHTNVPGSPRDKRWEDVQILLDRGICVLTTMNIQHLESLNDQVRNISGVRVRETIPDWLVESADEVVMIDLTPRALIHRLERGVVYKPAKAESAKQNFFRESTLVALRELALRQTAHEVQQRIGDGSHPADSGRRAKPGVTGQRVLALVTPAPETAMVVRRARRMADFLGGECFAVAVEPSPLDALPAEARENLERHLTFAANLHLETRVLESRDVAGTLVEFCHRNRIAQIYLARPRSQNLFPWMSRDLVQQIVALAKDMQIVIVSGTAAR